MNELFNSLESADVVQLVSIILATATFIIAQSIQKRRDREIANRDIYQKLEFASIDLFRFEAANLDLIRPIWEEEKEMPPKGTAEYTATMNYVCQILNLFEIAIRFRKDKILPADIFGSWMAWFQLLISAPGFPIIWNEVKRDYLPDLQNIINGGLEIKNKETDEEKFESQFYEFVSFVLKCEIIRKWNKDSEKSLYTSFKQKNRNAAKLNLNSIQINNLKIRWLSKTDNANDLADLFIRNSDKNYISHGEIQEGRAINENDWSDNLPAHLTEEFNSVLQNNLFSNANLAGAFYENKLVGFALLEYTDSVNNVYATLSDIVVEKNFRNLEIGKKLVQWAVVHLKENNISNLYAESNLNNETAHSFLNKMGFKTISKVFLKNL